jgi:hypothetical protein
VELAPQRILHRAEIAKVYRLMDKPEAAAQEWQNVLGLRAAGTKDEQYQREARLALERFRRPSNRPMHGVARR